LAEKRAQKNNTDFIISKIFDCSLRSEALEVIEALALYKECFNYYKDKEVLNIHFHINSLLLLLLQGFTSN
jgi:hypothetical protein